MLTLMLILRYTASGFAKLKLKEHKEAVNAFSDAIRFGDKTAFEFLALAHSGYADEASFQKHKTGHFFSFLFLLLLLLLFFTLMLPFSPGVPLGHMAAGGPRAGLGHMGIWLAGASE
jgi:hypothetical protein